LEQVKRLIRDCLAHDRWNSGLSDERLAEKITTRIATGGSGVASANPLEDARGSFSTQH
jgi:hypothetical protein